MSVLLHLLSQWFAILEEEVADVQDFGNEQCTGKCGSSLGEGLYGDRRLR